MTKSTITRERLEWLTKISGRDDIDDVDGCEIRELASMALAALDDEPVGEFYEDGPLNWYQISNGDRVPDNRRIPLYRHAQQPVVPYERDNTVDADDHPLTWSFNEGWNACRAAMLQNVTLANEGDIQAGNSLEIPEGYVLVPREPTDEMIAAAMDCDDVLFNSDETFCVQFGNIYDAMIAAAPQEVTSARVHPARDENAG